MKTNTRVAAPLAPGCAVLCVIAQTNRALPTRRLGDCRVTALCTGFLPWLQGSSTGAADLEYERHVPVLHALLQIERLVLARGIVHPAERARWQTPAPHSPKSKRHHSAAAPGSTRAQQRVAWHSHARAITIHTWHARPVHVQFSYQHRAHLAVRVGRSTDSISTRYHLPSSGQNSCMGLHGGPPARSVAGPAGSGAGHGQPTQRAGQDKSLGAARSPQRQEPGLASACRPDSACVMSA